MFPFIPRITDLGRQTGRDWQGFWFVFPLLNSFSEARESRNEESCHHLKNFPRRLRPFIIKMTPPRQSGVGGRRSLKSCPPAGSSLSQYHLSTCPEQLVPFAASFPGQLGALPIAQTTQPGTEMLRCFSHSESWWQKTHPASSRLSIPISTLKWWTETSVQMNHLLISYQILANKEPSLVLAMLPNVMATLADLETISLHFSKMERISSIITFSVIQCILYSLSLRYHRLTQRFPMRDDILTCIWIRVLVL